MPAPWDIGKPQKPFIDVADRITGSVLDADCGTGDTAISSLNEGWSIESIEAVQIEVRPDLKDMTFSEGGPKAWFVVVKRLGR